MRFPRPVFRPRIVRAVMAVGLLAALVPASGAKAQEKANAGGGDAELGLLEKDYLDGVVVARRDLGDKYLAALQRLQDSLTQSGKLEDALLVKQERERTLELLAQRPEVGAVADARVTINPVFLRGNEAAVQGKVKLSEANGALFAWEKEGTYAEWTLPAEMVPGDYEVILHCSAAEGEGGAFDVTLGDDQELSATIAGDGEWSDWRDIHAGNFSVAPEGGLLRVTATDFTNARLMNLQYVMLAPGGTWEKIQNGESVAPLDDDAAGEKPSRAADAEFTEIKNARYVSDPENDADSFVVSDGKELHKLRLYFVDAPHGTATDYVPEDPKSMRNIETEAAYFGITPEQSLEIGKEAASYVGRLLAGQSLTVYTRMERDARRSDRFYGMVIVNGKTLSSLLVEQGYARIDGQTTELPNGSEASSYLETLKTAEAAAKAARRGAWGKAPP